MGLPVNAHPTYWGGHVIQHVHIVGVRYGDPNTSTFLPQLSGAAPSVETFLTGLPQSSYFDMLSEYGAGGELIGRGSFEGMHTITPATDPHTIDDTQIQTELDAQVGAHALPTNDANTLYVLFFPEGQRITLGADSSFNAFCAYHGTTATDHLRYVVMPYRASDTDTTPGVMYSCGRSPGMGNFTSVLSHEVSEAVTDPDVGIANPCAIGGPCAPPLAWVDANTGKEISDICNQMQKPVKLADGFRYVVQENWSIQLGRCAATGPVRTISVGDAAMAEGDSGGHVLNIPVTLSEASRLPITVNYSIAGAGAHPATAGTGPNPAPGADFDNGGTGTGSVTFPMLSPTKSKTLAYIPVTIYGDTNAEPDETVQVTLSSEQVGSMKAGYGFERAVGTGTIVNDDPSATLVNASVSSVAIVVPQGKTKALLTVPVTLNRPDASAVNVTFSVVSLDATPLDYVGTHGGTLSIKAEDTAASINFLVKPHLDAGSNKTITVTLTGVSSTSGDVSLNPNANAGTESLLRAS